MKQTIEVLISCMHRNTVEDVKDLILRTKVTTHCVVVSQCDHNEYYEDDKTKIIFTTERGLSKSRNLAISYANNSSICLICDDDEILSDGYQEIIERSYLENPKASLITFSLNRLDIDNGKNYPKKNGILKFKQVLRTSSQQISFKKSAVLDSNISFDVKMGSGTGNGGSEEIKFILDFYRKKQKILYCSDVIATIIPGESQWFKGFTSEYIQNLGWSSRRALGNMVGLAYCCYWILSHSKLYIHDRSIFSAYYNIIKGYLSRR